MALALRRNLEPYLCAFSWPSKQGQNEENITPTPAAPTHHRRTPPATHRRYSTPPHATTTAARNPLHAATAAHPQPHHAATAPHHALSVGALSNL
ncbi:hypothetical protein KSP39_PZI014154 [Platanthera zijinensis]|uniref:Uncharacterized protein n=1 Tax=Platanthera zijinensis TaxID=2320716 RepID=A0AAP0BCH3_9ASPA